MNIYQSTRVVIFSVFWVLLIATYQLSLFRQRIKHLTDQIVLFIIMLLNVSNYFFYNAEQIYSKCYD